MALSNVKSQLLIVVILVFSLLVCLSPNNAIAQEKQLIRWVSKTLFGGTTFEVSTGNTRRLTHFSTPIFRKSGNNIFIEIREGDNQLGSISIGEYSNYFYDLALKVYPKLDGGESDVEWAERIGLIIKPKVSQFPVPYQNKYNETLSEWKGRQLSHLQKFLINEKYFGYNHRISHKENISIKYTPYIRRKIKEDSFLSIYPDRIRYLERIENLYPLTQYKSEIPKYFNSDPSLIAVVPDPKSQNMIDQYKGIYRKNKTVTYNEILNIRKLATDLTSSDGHVSFAPDSKNKLIQEIKNSDSNFIVVLGHNDKNIKSYDARISFANNETIYSRELHEICLNLEKRCAVLTCFGDDFSLEESISQRDVITMWSEGMTWFRNQSTNEISIEEFILEMRLARLNNKNRSKIILVSSSIGIGGGTILLYNYIDY